MVTITKMTLDDLNNIKDILISDFDDFWNYSILKSELESPNSYYIVIKNNSKIIGFAGIKVSPPDCDIMNIVIKKDFRNQGFGSLLLEELIKLSKSLDVQNIFLEVNEQNLPAISLYNKLGLKKISTRKNYYKENNAIIMKLDLSQKQ